MPQCVSQFLETKPSLILSTAYLAAATKKLRALITALRASEIRWTLNRNAHAHVSRFVSVSSLRRQSRSVLPTEPTQPRTSKRPQTTLEVLPGLGTAQATQCSQTKGP